MDAEHMMEFLWDIYNMRYGEEYQQKVQRTLEQLYPSVDFSTVISALDEAVDPYKISPNWMNQKGEELMNALLLYCITHQREIYKWMQKYFSID